MTSRATHSAAALAIAAALAVSAEGLRQKPYLDPPGILTVCYGSTRNVVAGRVYSLAECRQRLDDEMRAAIAQVEQCAPGLPDHVLAAFGDAVYNLGPKVACDTHHSAAARLLKRGDIVAACNELARWDKARIGGEMVSLAGLKARRERERDICLGSAPEIAP